ncbi:MAG: UDP-N-acetylglucosamine 1-carboxyvinyltransferase [Alphaproteobacteria bacterium]|nr:MAG: UDP-N-acetylglucosamine 1-carboxyvinyltransferase [Alphaproteobacteria bacterium]
MDKITITGGKPLHGAIHISGAKNAALPLLCVTLLTNQAITLTNVPKLADVESMLTLLEHLGTHVENRILSDRTLVLQTPTLASHEAPYDIVRKMRASILSLGPLLAREGKARVSLPGGCAIGTRPVNFHIEGLRTMGATIAIENGYIEATAPHGLTGAEIVLPLPSVTGTENLMMAAALAHGTTTLINAASEPEIGDLANCLLQMGVTITGIGTSTLRITGVPNLTGATHAIIADRIEAGTYAVAALITDGELELIGANLDTLPVFRQALERAGALFTPTAQGFTVKRNRPRMQGVDVITEYYPGFATDLQAQFMVLMSLAEGVSVIKETIWENRFMHVPELSRMGADIRTEGNNAFVQGKKSLNPAEVMATDLRASVSLVLAALATKGETTISRVYHLDRGYENIEQKLSAVGATISRIVGEPV